MISNLVSIIIPYYNSEKTIERCLKSIIKQTYKKLEIILVSDDGSDNTTNIIKEYQRSDSRIKLILKEHTGVSETRNRGLKEANGEFILFVDSDDDIEPNMISLMLSKLKRTHSDVAVCNYHHPSIKNYLKKGILNLSKKEDLLKYYQTTFAFVVPWNKLYRRSVITNGFDSSVSFCEDELFGIANLKNIKKVVSIESPLYHYFMDTSLDLEHSSCIVKLARSKDFNKTKKTYWYLRKELFDKTYPYFKEFKDPDLVLDLSYSRLFDFMIWELLIMDQCGANHDLLRI